MWMLLSLLWACAEPEVEPVASPEAALVTVQASLDAAVERHELRDREGADQHWLDAHRTFDASIAHRLEPGRSLRLQYQLGVLRRRLQTRRAEPGPEVKAWTAAVQTAVDALPKPEPAPEEG